MAHQKPVLFPEKTANYLTTVKICSITLAACLFSTTPFAADADASPFSFHVPREAALLVVGAAGQLTGQYRLSNMAPVRPGEPDRADLLPFDRWNAGTWNPRAAVASDVLVWSVGGAMLYADLWHGVTGPEHGGAARRPFLEDALILSQAYLWNSGLNLHVRAARVHPRPFVYGSRAPEAERLKGEAAGGFYSGHASAAFLGAVYVSTVYPLRHPEFEHRAWLWTGSLAAATATAGLRVAAGKHFPSDVVAGAAIGSLVGWTFVQLHLKENTWWGWRATPWFTPEGAPGLAAARRF